MHVLSTLHRPPEMDARPFKDWPSSFAIALARLDEWYQEGKPFFTKNDLEDLSNQLNRRYPTRRTNAQRRLIAVKGLTGSVVLYSDLTGQIIPNQDPNEEWAVKSPYVRYVCYEKLKEVLRKPNANIVEAFYPMQIDHLMLRRAINTKKPLTPKWAECPEPVEQYLKQHLESWKKTTEYHKLEKILKLFKHDITKVINLGSGWMEFGMGLEEFSRCATQHALTIVLYQLLQKKTNNTIKHYAQDPAYTAVDILALSLHGCEVLEDPQALIEIDDDSVVFACCPGFPLKDITTDIARPAMLIWDQVHERFGARSQNPNSPRVREMIAAHYDCHRFWDQDPQHPAPFKSDLVVYIRRRK